jgi:hypothetical protein
MGAQNGALRAAPWLAAAVEAFVASSAALALGQTAAAAEPARCTCSL